MKICFFGSDYPPTGGGIATYVVETLRAISNSPSISNMVVYIFGNKEPREEKAGDKIRVTTFATKNFFVLGLLVLQKMWANRDADIFHALYVFPVGFWVVLWSKLLRKPSLLTIYGTDVCSKEASVFVQRLKKYTVSNATKVIAISNFTKQASAEALGLSMVDDHTTVIYPTVPKVTTTKTESEVQDTILELQKRFAIPTDAFPLLLVCRLVSRKGIEYSIDAIAQISDSRVVLLIAGDGPERKRFEAVVRERNLSHRIFFLGKVPDLVPLYRMAKVGLLPSFSRVAEGDFEGLGLVLLEAQSFGLPVIGTNSGGIPEAFDPGVTGVLVPEQDPAALALAIETLRTDTILYAKMSTATRVFLEHRFGQERMVREHFSVVESIS